MSRSDTDSRGKACVTRLGAYGDHLMVTPLLKVMKEDRWSITYNTSERGLEVLKYNPNIDKFLFQETGQVPQEQLGAFFHGMSKKYDKYVNLCESIEGTLLAIEGRNEWNWTHEKRHQELGHINYFDRTLEIGGYGHIKGMNPELHFTALEHSLAKAYRKKYRDKFLILWSLSGSSYHKAYPYAEDLAIEFLECHEDAMTLTVGDSFCTVIDWRHPRAKSYSDVWPIRQSMIMTGYVDLVLGGETGLLHAAACYDTPKIILLSHSSEENLTKYWINCHSIHAGVECYPCHKLHYRLDTCPHNPVLKSPVCMSMLEPSMILEKMELVYEQWKVQNGSLHRNRRQAVSC